MAPARRFPPARTVVSGVLLLLLSTTALSAQTLTVTRPDTPPVVGGPLATVLPAGRDFATEVLGDPWDFEQESDWIRAFSLDGLDPTTSAWADTPVLENGKFKGRSRTTQPVLSLQFEGLGGNLNLATRTGVRFPIDAGKYTRLSFRMRRSVRPAEADKDLPAAHWYTKTTRTEDPHTAGAHQFTAHGWNPHVKALRQPDAARGARCRQRVAGLHDRPRTGRRPPPSTAESCGTATCSASGFASG